MTYRLYWLNPQSGTHAASPSMDFLGFNAALTCPGVGYTVASTDPGRSWGQYAPNNGIFTDSIWEPKALKSGPPFINIGFM
jgi:hypothetical protein